MDGRSQSPPTGPSHVNSARQGLTCRRARQTHIPAIQLRVKPGTISVQWEWGCPLYGVPSSGFFSACPNASAGVSLQFNARPPPCSTTAMHDQVSACPRAALDKVARCLLLLRSCRCRHNLCQPAPHSACLAGAPSNKRNVLGPDITMSNGATFCLATLRFREATAATTLSLRWGSAPYRMLCCDKCAVILSSLGPGAQHVRPRSLTSHDGCGEFASWALRMGKVLTTHH